MSLEFIADDAPRPYDETFYRYQREGSVRSARGVLPGINALLRPASILDVGCGAGAWLSVHRELDVQDVTGIDGDYVDRSVLLFDPARFVPADISKPFDLRRSFDLVQCLEVGEHVPKASSEALVDNLVRHGKRVLFSAAVPGQGGENHVNEQGYGFWRDLFARRGYLLFDFVRPLIGADTRIEPWYRYNLLFFVAAEEAERLPDAIRRHLVDSRSGVPDVSPPGYKARKLLLRWLPVRIKTRIAVLKSRMVVNRLKRNGENR
ncbi:class I SAM-dependent methyltransferase [Burkholderia sp. S-53]|uniref:class I SAM-dependent methyltransferase n=1 Tax=Burkholderia sp. S-53 TaxID=2906514 RepID=UPI0021D279C5|nr:class I SAM-dependent methyltransferase [Burkholderia sp. S-53]UXU87857.1 class I SAM-dependent methyltransferase [Burkholderia sp. S-53]